ncbi:MAG: protease pro-enzyme activation domain-containing protein [Terracidiphilus sp.]
MKVRVLQRLFLYAAIVSFSIPNQAEQALQVLHHHVRPAVSKGQTALVGPVPATQRMQLSIVLPLRNQSELTSLLQRIYDPSSSDYRHFLSVEQFTQQFGPTAEDYQAVVDFARANGFTVTGKPANRMVVPINGSVAQVEKAFNVRMNVYRHPTENRTFFSPDREPSLDLRLPVAHIAGLNNFSNPRPLVKKGPAGQALATAAAVGSGPGGSYLASDMRAAYYGGTALTGSGQAVGLVEFDGYNISDVTSSFAGTATSSSDGGNYLLAYTPTAGGATYSIPIDNVLLDGATGASVSGDDSEMVLDIVQAIGMAPGLSQIRVYIGTSDVDVLNSMASENLVQQLSISWTWSPDDPSTDDPFFQEFAAQGQSVFAASGDYGEFDPLIDNFYPAESAWVTSVGGTSMVTNGSGGAWSSETAWNSNGFASGGGISPDGIPIPNWQAGVATSSNGGSATLRNVPDVAAESDFDNYNCNMGVCQGTYAGTSFAAPRWAGFMALVNQQSAAAGSQPVGFVNPALYGLSEGTSYQSDFHDITTGNNSTEGGCCGQAFFYAVPGYDLVTGWGSPTGQALIDALAPPASAGFQLSTSPSSLTIDPGASGETTITVKDVGGFTGSVNLSVSGLPSGMTASWGTDPTAGTSVLTLTVSSSAIRGSYLLTITGASGTLTAITSLALSVNAPGFSITPTFGTLQLNPGNSNADVIAVTDYAGFSGSVSLVVTAGLPSGVTATWGTNPATGSALLTLTASNSTTPVRTMVTITGTSGALNETATIALTINAPLLFLNVSPIPFTLVQGNSATATVTVVPDGNFTGSVTLAAPVLPSGVTATFSPNPTTGTSVVTMTASTSAPLGASSVNFTGTASGVVSLFPFQQTVAASPSPTFTIGVAPAALTLTQGTSVTDTVTITPQNGFTGNVSLAVVSGLPIGVTASFGTNPTAGTSVLTLTASNTAIAGSGYILTIQGTAGYSKPALLYLTVNPAPSFTLTTSPASMTVIQGTSGTSSITMTPQTGFTGSVTLGAPSLPSGLTASFAPNPTSGSSVLSLTASSLIPPGNYLVIITGTSGAQTVTAPISVAVTAPTPTTTTLSISPSGGTLATGAPYTLTATVFPASGSNVPTGNVVFAIGSATQTVALNSSGIATYTGTAPQTAGTLMLSATYQGTSTFLASTSNNLNETISVPRTVPAVTVTPSSSNITTVEPLTVTVNVNGGSGNPTPTGTVTLTSGSYSSTATTLSGGSVMISVPPGSLATGTDTLTANYSGDGNYNATTGTTAVTVMVPPPPSFTVSGIAVTVSPGGTTGNTSEITVTPAAGFSGSVSLTAAITSSPTSAQYPPTLSFGSTSPVSITGTTAGTATLTINTTAATSAALIYPKRHGVPRFAAGGATLACILLFAIPARRRRWQAILGMLVLFFALGGGVLACGGGGGSNGGGGGGGTSNPGTTAGTYTVTVTGTSGATTATGAVALTIQ